MNDDGSSHPRAWAAGTATAIGSMPGTDPVETARLLASDAPELMPFPELPARGVGADVLGRTAGMLVDLAVELAPSGYRASRGGRDQRRAVDLLRWDVDAVEHAAAEYGPRTIKVQAAGPWTLAAGIELERGHRVLTDPGALRDFTSSLTEGLLAHVANVRARTGARVVVQLDEPTLPSVLAGSLPTPSAYGNVAAVPEPEAQRLLGEVIEQITETTGDPVALHCCAPRPPVGLFRRAGAGAISLDATGLGSVAGALADELGEAWDQDVALLLGLVPTTEPEEEPSVRELAQPAFDFAARLGFGRRELADRALVTPTCGLAGASQQWARRALRLSRDITQMLAQEAES